MFISGGYIFVWPFVYGSSVMDCNTRYYKWIVEVFFSSLACFLIYLSNKPGILYYDYYWLLDKLLLFLFYKLLWLKASVKCIHVFWSLPSYVIYVQVENGLIVVAYKDGSPAHAHFLNSEQILPFWEKWLLRLEEYAEK